MDKAAVTIRMIDRVLAQVDHRGNHNDAFHPGCIICDELREWATSMLSSAEEGA